MMKRKILSVLPRAANAAGCSRMLDYAAAECSTMQLRYGVRQGSVSRVLGGLLWKHVSADEAGDE